jgi:hypothetical protein
VALARLFEVEKVFLFIKYEEHFIKIDGAFKADR